MSGRVADSMYHEHISRFLVPSRMAGLFFVALAVAALSWSLRAHSRQWFSICLAVSTIPVLAATAPREDLMGPSRTEPA